MPWCGFWRLSSWVCSLLDFQHCAPETVRQHSKYYSWKGKRWHQGSKREKNRECHSSPIPLSLVWCTPCSPSSLEKRRQEELKFKGSGGNIVWNHLKTIFWPQILANWVCSTNASQFWGITASSASLTPTYWFLLSLEDMLSSSTSPMQLELVFLPGSGK